MNSKIYWIWLQRCLGVSFGQLGRALKVFGSINGLYNANPGDYSGSGLFTPGCVKKLSDKDLDYAEDVFYKCELLGIDVIPFSDSRYPRRLASISAPPVVLYAKGKLPEENSVFDAVVGTRNPDESGKALAYNMGCDLARSGHIVVSGGALGVDIFSHRGALDAGGKTICVIACGIDRYRSSYQDIILERIPERGAVVSEYPPGYPQTKAGFPIRDRIISGLADAVTVVQAGTGSGALITVKTAYEQGRKVFAFPGSCSYPHALGTNMMIKYGFSAVLSYRDILNWHDKQRLDPDEPEELNPPLTREMKRKLSTRDPDIRPYQKPGRMLLVPYGYAGDLAAEDDFYREQRLSSGKEKAPAKPAGTVSGFSGTIPDDQILSDETAGTSLRSERERELEYLHDLKRRAEKGEREPLDSPLRKKGYDRDTERYKRLMEIERLSKKLNVSFGLYQIPKERFLGIFQPDYYEKYMKGHISGDENQELPETGTVPGKKKETYTVKSRRRKKTASPEDTTDNAGEMRKKLDISEKNPINQLTKNAVSVYDTISDEPVGADQIKLLTGLDIGSVLSSLTELQIEGFVTKLPGGRYVRK